MRKRLTAALLAAAILSISASAAVACDGKSKASAVTASAEKADAKAHCASKASAVTADAKASCASKASAVTADSKASCASKASAVTADAKASCASKRASAVTASASSCAKGDKAAKAASANSMACRGGLEASVTHAAANAGSGVDAVVAGSSCSSHSAKIGTTAAKSDCAVCDEYAGCDEKLKGAGAVTQVVPLKNGVMFVYTASGNKNVRTVQAAVQSRQDRLTEIATASTSVTLCDGCKSMRGAMASGKLRREVVNVEGGSLTLVTSDDASVVKAIQEVSGVAASAVKS